MKNRILLFITLTFAIFSCEEENKVEDPIYEFASFKGTPTVNINELENSESAYPMVVQLFAFKPYPDDIELSLEVTGNNTVENVDFTVTPQTSVKIRAGNLVSDTIFIKTIDNGSGSLTERSFDIRISAISNPDIKMGLGINEPKNAAVTVNILDDECSNTPEIYNTTLSNTLDWGYDPESWNETGVILSATGSYAGDHVTIAGDLIYYDGFIPGNISLDIMLQPETPGAIKGKATFGELLLGNATDGYEYRLLEIGEGTFDLCSGIITTKFVLEYKEGADWLPYYYVASVYSLP